MIDRVTVTDLLLIPQSLLKVSLSYTLNMIGLGDMKAGFVVPELNNSLANYFS